MILQIYSMLFLVALVATAGVIWVGAQGGVGRVQVGGEMGIVLSAAVFVLWGLLAIESFEIVIIDNGTRLTESYQELAWLCVGGAAIALLSMVQASIEEIKDRGGI